MIKRIAITYFLMSCTHGATNIIVLKDDASILSNDSRTIHLPTQLGVLQYDQLFLVNVETQDENVHHNLITCFNCRPYDQDFNIHSPAADVFHSTGVPGVYRLHLGATLQSKQGALADYVQNNFWQEDRLENFVRKRHKELCRSQNSSISSKQQHLPYLGRVRFHVVGYTPIGEGHRLTTRPLVAILKTNLRKFLEDNRYSPDESNKIIEIYHKFIKKYTDDLMSKVLLKNMKKYIENRDEKNFTFSEGHYTQIVQDFYARLQVELPELIKAMSPKSETFLYKEINFHNQDNQNLFSYIRRQTLHSFASSTIGFLEFLGYYVEGDELSLGHGQSICSTTRNSLYYNESACASLANLCRAH